MQYIACAVFVLLLTMGFSPSAHACKCAKPTIDTATQTFAETNAVILAEPVFFSKGWGGNKPLVKLKVLHTYKGSVADEVTAQYNSMTAACGLALETGKKYILGMADLFTESKNLSREGGFRLLSSCQQDNLYYYLMKLDAEESEADVNKQPESEK